MVRTLISFDDKELKKIDRIARNDKKSRAQLIREAMVQYVAKKEKKLTWKEIVKQTAGIWKDRKIDSVEYVRKLRAEWDRDLK